MSDAAWAIPRPDDARSATNDAGRWALLVSRACIAVERAAKTGVLSPSDRVALETLATSLGQAADTLAYLENPSGSRPAGRLAPIDVAVRTVRQRSPDAAHGNEQLTTRKAIEVLRQFEARVARVVNGPERADEALAELLHAIATDAAAEAGTTGDTVATF